MSKRIPKVLLLAALLAVFVSNSARVFGGSKTCSCYRSGDRNLGPPGGCHFDQRTLQCVNSSCPGTCL
jgi:hypothetical protein